MKKYIRGSQNIEKLYEFLRKRKNAISIAVGIGIFSAVMIHRSQLDRQIVQHRNAAIAYEYSQQTGMAIIELQKQIEIDESELKPKEGIVEYINIISDYERLATDYYSIGRFSKASGSWKNAIRLTYDAAKKFPNSKSFWDDHKVTDMFNEVESNKLYEELGDNQVYAPI